jgi:SAM-dependent methyltransferase
VKLYGELAGWYHLIDPLTDHEDEGTAYRDALLSIVKTPRPSLLELGCGAGNNAYYVKSGFPHCTLTDLSPEMLALSRARNPECEHVQGDMRTLRLGRFFDAVLVHDSICYMRSEDELRQAFVTAHEHLVLGGAACFAPDCVRETFVERTSLTENSDGVRAMRCIEWAWDPDPDDSVYSVDYGFLLRQGSEAVRMAHDHHDEGVFPRETWLRLLRETGFEPRVAEGPDAPFFLCRKDR